MRQLHNTNAPRGTCKKGLLTRKILSLHKCLYNLAGSIYLDNEAKIDICFLCIKFIKFIDK